MSVWGGVLVVMPDGREGEKSRQHFQTQEAVRFVLNQYFLELGL